MFGISGMPVPGTGTARSPFRSTVGVSSKKKRWEANLANIEKKIGFYEETRSGGIGKNPA
jgi:hypothetical protein